MTTMLERPTAVTGGRPRQRSRDASVDLVRALCLLTVVALHAMMVGVGLVDGAPVIENAMERWSGFPIATWVVQVMPLFFVLGGFSAHRQWERMRARGEGRGDYLAQRLRRLLPPVLGAIGATALALGAISAAGLPAHLVAEAGLRLGQPLWFLGVYLLCTLLVPLMVRMHELAPTTTTLSLASAALGVDALRAITGIEAVGFANLLLVWLAAQQLGFWIADGTVDRWSRSAVRALGAGALALAGALCLLGLSSPDLFQALNPPSAVLVLLGVAQSAIMVLARERLRAVAQGRRAAAALGAINARAMTIYAWHMLVLIALAGASLSSPALLPTPLSEEWWWSRPLWLLAVAAATVVVVRVVGVLETGAVADGLDARIRGASPSGARIAAAYLVAAAGVLGVLVARGEPLAWMIAALALSSSLALARGSRPRRPRVRRARARAALRLRRAAVVP